MKKDSQPEVIGAVLAGILRRSAVADEPVAAEGDPDVAMFVPGNEEACRKQLTRVVAADPSTYTLGDPTGPLVIPTCPR